MKKLILITAIISILISLGCGTKTAPLDSQGKSPEQVMMETYTMIVEGNLEGALANFSDEYIEEFLTSKNITFEEYCSYTNGWKVEWLRTELMGNDYNKDVWRVKIIPDEGKGEHNGPGAVQDLYQIDGKWKIVFWSHYPKS